MTQRKDFEAFKLRSNSKYKPHDDSISDRHDWVVWQAAQAAQPATKGAHNVSALCAYEESQPPHAHAIDTPPGRVEKQAVDVQVPEGWKLVPVEPTQAMCRALFRNLIHADNEAYVIKAVMDAAPSTKEGGG